MSYFGLDIGGTKCAVSRLLSDGVIEETHRITTGTPENTLQALFASLAALNPGDAPFFGISCGGPLDAKRGIIQSPPNLPGWDDIAITQLVTRRFGGRAVLMNDANACALAEWRFGAGRECRNMIFLTFGTGMGAGLILNGRLYEGTCGNAGEIGHVRLAEEGPLGFGKTGSVEGFCSGGGIARLAPQMAGASGVPESWSDQGQITTRRLALAANAGDKAARKIFEVSGRNLGRTLAVLVDLLNPERIIIGGVFPRSEQLLRPSMEAELALESLAASVACCQIMPAKLGETIGSHGAIAAALHAFPEKSQISSEFTAA